MRLHKCLKVLNFLVENKMVDDRKIWCYAQMQARIRIHIEPVKIYGLVLVCVNQDELFLYNAEYNSTKLELMYSCRIDSLENIHIKKKLFSTRLSFSKEEENFQLEIDDWKPFSEVFCR